MTDVRKFAPAGPLALDPRAFGMLLLMGADPTAEDRDGVAVLSIRGPLEQFANPFCDSYGAIVERVAETLATQPRALVLSISSPGGVVAGCFEAALRIRSLCARAGVPLLSHVDGMACSAAYALACAAPHIAASPTSTVGSIGVIAEVVDATAANALQGVAVRMLASGARKSDGQQAVQTSGPALTSMQGIVDRLAAEFFAWVAASRGINVDAVRMLEAGIFIGADAQGMSLTDSTQTLDELLASIGTLTPPAVGATGDETKDPHMTIKITASKAYEDAIAALRKCAEGDDDCASKAKRMLKAELAEDDAPAKEPDGDEPPPPPPPPPKKDEDDAKAEAPPFPPKKDDGDDAKALRADVAALKASEAARIAQAVAIERSTLIASRPDFSPKMVAMLSKASTSIETVREMVATLERGPVRNLAAAAGVTGTRGEGQASGHVSQQTPEAALAMRTAMGLEPAPKMGVIDAGNVLILGAPLPGKTS